MRVVRFDFPAGMEPQNVADTLTAYILAKLAASNENRKFGPFEISDKPDTWRLTDSCPLVLEVIKKSSEGIFSCPDLWLYDMANALVKLFQLQYNCAPPAQ